MTFDSLPNVCRSTPHIRGLKPSQSNPLSPPPLAFDGQCEACRFRQVALLSRATTVDLPGKNGEHQLRNQEVFYEKRKQADAGFSA